TIRWNLCQGTTKLIGGESIDVIWIALSDFNQDVFRFLNTHLEDGTKNFYLQEYPSFTKLMSNLLFYFV
ncbi:MAG: hypothetical protein ACTSSI_15375, partial [Candidatus Helarchaeota archaeon]